MDNSVNPEASALHRPLTPRQRFEADLARDGFVRDAAQERAVSHLQRLYDELVAAPAERKKTTLPVRPVTSLLRGFLGRQQQQDAVTSSRLPEISGLYFWGGVGRGKTYLMDCFYESLPFEQKMRTHFHRFMQRVHAELENFKGQNNPLQLVAQRFSEEARVICFDEFFVSDITDAMILANLLDALFARNVVLVATSNIEPENLYRDGLQRTSFLPAIALLEEHCDVVNVDSGVDYRLRALERAKIFYTPLDESAEREMARSFQEVAGTVGQREIDIEINQRKLHARRLSDDVAWFEFSELCDGPRSQNDYIELARRFGSVLVSNVPRMRAGQDDQARRFIDLVDEFYDRGVKLLMSAEVAINELYADGRLEFEFQRTLSRLLEMQSRSYLSQPHRP
ncbi:cell division protein ZapE [Halomonas halocynthiae]|uniref:cell division protein ZapE n=1 Tax=Halomonas halocynthiae TaxID=176290 RepID=UPI000683D73C|nr:cell division protein ZapE [Halomonas halocynthiae]